MSLSGRTLFITGASRGIGKAIALRAAADGANVAIAAKTSDPHPRLAGTIHDTAREVEAAGGRALPLVVDVRDHHRVAEAVAEAAEHFGGLDIVVNNAGIVRDAIFHKITDEEWDQVIDVHLNGAYNVSRAAANIFRQQSSGRMIHMTSTSGLIGNFGQANYAAAKMGIVGLSRSVALDMARYNVTSNAIGPFAWSRLIGTIPIKSEEERKRVERLKSMTPAKVAPLVTALASDAAQHVSGQIFVSRGSEVMLMSQPRPVRSMARPDKWTPETILDHAFPAFSSTLCPLERSSDVFCWDPV